MGSMFFAGRYILLLMGLFSIYTGFLYNDYFGLPVEILVSRYTFNAVGDGTFSGFTYEFGLDPAWYECNNKLSFINSLKMKMAIIFGVSHMLIGLVISLLNRFNKKEFAFIVMENIPEFLLLSCTFGYLSFMILLKWCLNWDTTAPPDLLHTMSQFFLSPQSANDPPLYTGQLAVQITLLVITILSVPWLLCCAPIYEIVHHKLTHKNIKKKNIPTQPLANDLEKDEHSETSQNESIHIEKNLIEGKQNIHESHDNEKHESHETTEEPHEKPFSIQDICVNQLIHTIEFALGTVSNTASYLRLWALSLAHSQLSEVFFRLTIKLVLTLPINIYWLNILFNTGGPLIVAYLVWIGLTMAVLLGMEALGAFLHSLRLHWVEFQNKFYKGDGRRFDPFSYENIYSQTKLQIE